MNLAIEPEYEPRQFLDSRLLTDILDSVQPTPVDVSETACFPDMAVDYASCGFFLKGILMEAEGGAAVIVWQ